MSTSDNACLSIVVPVYNEEQTLSLILRKLLKVPHLLEIVVVDDCSSDQTPEILASMAQSDARISCVRHAKNMGKTAALVTGFQRTRGSIVIVQDADLEYDPDD